MKAVILAAGIASRLRPLTDTTPKCLLKVGERCLLQRAFDALLQNGFREFVIVTGYRQQQIVVSVKSVIPSSDIKKGAVSKALIVRTKKEIRRADGSYIRFDDNACVLLNNAGEIRGSRIFGPVARELRATNMKVVSLAPEVL